MPLFVNYYKVDNTYFTLEFQQYKSYQLFWQATPAAESLNGFWDECERPGNLGILQLQKMYNGTEVNRLRT